METMIPSDDPARLLSAFVEGIEGIYSETPHLRRPEQLFQNRPLHFKIQSGRTGQFLTELKTA